MASNKWSENVADIKPKPAAEQNINKPAVPHVPEAFWTQEETFDLSSGKYLKIWQGPQHPGVTGNMALELVVEGDIVRSCKTHVGYLHRGFEKLMERRKYIQCFPIVCRICVPEPDTNEYLFAAAVEELANIEIPEKAAWIRGPSGSGRWPTAITFWTYLKNSPAGACTTCTSFPVACAWISRTASKTGCGPFWTK